MTNKEPKTKLYLGNLILLLVSTALAFCLCEFIVRFFKIGLPVIQQIGVVRFVDNPKMVYEIVPESIVCKNKINKQGFHDKDFTIEKPKNLIRIAMLGDSITQGIFISQDKTFSAKLEELLNQKAKERHSPLKYEVMNFGVAGYNLEAEVEVLKEKSLAYKPDIVILNMYSNDNDPIPGVDIFFINNYYQLTKEQRLFIVKKYVENRDSWTRKFERNVLYKSKLYLLAAYKLRALMNNKIIEIQTDDMDPIYRGFKEIDKLREQYKFKFLVCLHPNLLFYEDDNNFAFASIAKSFHFNCFFMTPYYQKTRLTPDSLQLKEFPEDTIHPNELGHALIANAMFLELTKRNFIKFQ